MKYFRPKNVMKFHNIMWSYVRGSGVELLTENRRQLSASHSKNNLADTLLGVCTSWKRCENGRPYTCNRPVRRRWFCRFVSTHCHDTRNRYPRGVVITTSKLHVYATLIAVCSRCNHLRWSYYWKQVLRECWTHALQTPVIATYAAATFRAT